MSTPRRKHLERAFLLHHRPWSDSSRILELVTELHGRITLFAHGARRPKSRLRAVLRPFAPLLVSWSGRPDGGTLTGAEAVDATFEMPPDRVLAAFYLNELLLRLLPKEDRQEAIFDAYAQALRALAAGAEQQALRAFERVLLDELGYGPDLTRDAASGEPLATDRYYHFQPGRGVLAVRDAGPDAWSGRDVLAVARGELDSPPALRVARGIYAAALAHCLEGQGLASREVLRAMRRRQRGR